MAPSSPGKKMTALGFAYQAWMERRLRHKGAGKVEQGGAVAAFQFEFQLVHAKLFTVRFDRALVDGDLDPVGAGFEHDGPAFNIHFEGGSQCVANGRFAGETREGGIFDRPKIELGPAGLRFPFVALDTRRRKPLDGLNMAFPDRPA